MFWHQRELIPAKDDAAPPLGECMCSNGWPCPTLMVLSHTYADHPDFKMKWRRPFGQAAPDQPTKMEK